MLPGGLESMLLQRMHYCAPGSSVALGSVNWEFLLFISSILFLFSLAPSISFTLALPTLVPLFLLFILDLASSICRSVWIVPMEFDCQVSFAHHILGPFFVVEILNSKNDVSKKTHTSDVFMTYFWCNDDSIYDRIPWCTSARAGKQRDALVSASVSYEQTVRIYICLLVYFGHITSLSLNCPCLVCCTKAVNSILFLSQTFPDLEYVL